MYEQRSYFDLLSELENNANVHRPIIRQIEKELKRSTVLYIANAGHPGGLIDDYDADVFENVLRSLELPKYEHKLTVILDSPGGLPYSAEKVVHVCRTYSESFQVVVINQAMSAATLLCLGAEKILLGETSKLGP